MLPNIAQIIPRQVFAEGRCDYALRFKLKLSYIGPTHHIADQLFHIDNWRNEIRLINQPVDSGIHAEKCADAVRNDNDVLIFVLQPYHRITNFFTRLPRGKGMIIQPNHLAAGEQRSVMFALRGVSAFAMDI